MPLFGYICESCEQEHELLVRSDALPDCPDCGSAQMVKLMSAFAPKASNRMESTPSSCGATVCCGMRNGCGMN